MTTTDTKLRFPYGRTDRYHLQHIHLFSQDIAHSIDFYTRWFDAQFARWLIVEMQCADADAHEHVACTIWVCRLSGCRTCMTA